MASQLPAAHNLHKIYLAWRQTSCSQSLTRCENMFYSESECTSTYFGIVRFVYSQLCYFLKCLLILAVIWRDVKYLCVQLRNTMCSTNCLLLSITSHKYLDEVMKIAVMTKLHLFLDEFEYFGRSSTFPTASASSYKSFSLMRPMTTAGFKSFWFECEFARKKSKYAVPSMLVWSCGSI